MGKSRKRSEAQKLVAENKKSRPNDDGSTSGHSNSEPGPAELPAPAQVSEEQQAVSTAPSFPVVSSTLQNWITQVHTSSGQLQGRKVSTSRAKEWVVYQLYTWYYPG